MQRAGLALILVVALLSAPTAAPAATSLVVGTPPPAVAPVTGAVVRPFDPPQSRYGRGHRGVDLSSARGELVVAALDGVVGFAGNVAGEQWVTLRHAGGLETTYGGVAATVEVGDAVALGQPVGRMRRGRRHLDWGVRLGDSYLDPMGLLAGWRAILVPVRVS